MSERRAHEAAGRHIEVQFAGESQALILDVDDDADCDGVADALVSTLQAATFDEAEGQLQERLESLGGSVRRGP